MLYYLLQTELPSYVTFCILGSLRASGPVTLASGALEIGLLLFIIIRYAILYTQLNCITVFTE